jgi:hypothetical protein
VLKKPIGKLSSVEIKSHFGLKNQLEDTIGQAPKELVGKRMEMAPGIARTEMMVSHLFTKVATESLMMSLKPHRHRKGSKIADNERLGSSGQVLERIDGNSKSHLE